MRGTFLIIFAAFTVCFSSIQAELEKQSKTSLYMISSEKDYVGSGDTHFYREGDGNFSIRFNQSCNILDFYFEEHTRDDYEYDNKPHYTANWNGRFSSKIGEILQVGTYLDSSRFRDKDHPGLDISGCGRGCNNTTGQFEILEMTFNTEGEIESFAANATQYCGNKRIHPLFTSVRYNSNTPVSVKVSDIYGKRQLPESFLCTLSRDTKTGYSSNPEFYSDNEGEFKYKFYSDIEEGLIINFEKNGQEYMCLEFSTYNKNGFSTGLEDNNYEKRSDELIPNIEIKKDRTYFSYWTEAEFKVLSFEKNKYGQVEELALNFRIKEKYEDRVFEGAIRYHSDLPVNLDSPYDE